MLCQELTAALPKPCAVCEQEGGQAGLLPAASPVGGRHCWDTLTNTK